MRKYKLPKTVGFNERAYNLWKNLSEQKLTSLDFNNFVKSAYFEKVDHIKGRAEMERYKIKVEAEKGVFENEAKRFKSESRIGQ